MVWRYGCGLFAVGFANASNVPVGLSDGRNIKLVLKEQAFAAIHAVAVVWPRILPFASLIWMKTFPSGTFALPVKTVGEDILFWAK